MHNLLPSFEVLSRAFAINVNCMRPCNHMPNLPEKALLVLPKGVQAVKADAAGCPNHWAVVMTGIQLSSCGSIIDSAL